LQNVAEAIIGEDADEAERAMRLHVKRSGEGVLAAMAKE